MIALKIIQVKREQVILIWEMAITQSKLKRYDNIRRRELTFEEGNGKYLKVSPMKRVK